MLHISHVGSVATRAESYWMPVCVAIIAGQNDWKTLRSLLLLLEFATLAGCKQDCNSSCLSTYQLSPNSYVFLLRSQRCSHWRRPLLQLRIAAAPL